MTMEDLPKCEKCGSEYTYEDGHMYVCPECGHEWAKISEQKEPEEEQVVRDAYGNILKDGDNVTIIKDLKVKGSSVDIKVGHKVKGIRIVDEKDGHNISCKIKGFGAMVLKSEVVKKSS